MGQVYFRLGSIRRKTLRLRRSRFADSGNLRPCVCNSNPATSRSATAFMTGCTLKDLGLVIGANTFFNRRNERMATFARRRLAHESSLDGVGAAASGGIRAPYPRPQNPRLS